MFVAQIGEQSGGYSMRSQSWIIYVCHPTGIEGQDCRSVTTTAHVHLCKWLQLEQKILKNFGAPPGPWFLATWEVTLRLRVIDDRSIALPGGARMVRERIKRLIWRRICVRARASQRSFPIL